MSSLYISKHLMLLFISKGSWVFKNSFWISKHLMLLFIASANAWVLPNKTISKHLMLLFILHFHYLSDIFIYFKTSYVIVYLLTFACNLCSFIFQNILCYCLSITALIDEPIGLIFQNILCYCLSISAVQIVPHS